MKKILLSSFVFLSLISFMTPVAVVYAQAPKLDYSGFVKCDGELKDGEQGRQTRCDFAALMNTIVKLVNWLFYISIPLAIVMFAWSGALYMTGQKGNIDKAKGIFTAVAVGFIIMVVAWFVVRQVVEWFVADPAATVFVQ